MHLSRLRLTGRRLMVGVTVVGLILIVVAITFIIPARWERQTAREYFEQSRFFGEQALVAHNFARIIAEIRVKPELIEEVNEQEFKSFITLVCSFRQLTQMTTTSGWSQPTDNPLSIDIQQACENAWLKYDKIPERERIEWWEEHCKGFQRLSDYLSTLKLKYERAAREPWVPVEPDPPVPK